MSSSIITTLGVFVRARRGLNPFAEIILGSQQVNRTLLGV